jgi:hypothetical protein
LDLRDFDRYLDRSFIVGCERLIVCADFVDGVEKRGKGDGEGKKRWLVEKNSSEITDLTVKNLVESLH